MPRLSIIIPHRRNDVELENTILSVLENKPSDSEVIVVHDGSYANPYQLQDEVLLIRDQSSTDVGMINRALMVARAQIVCLLCNGATVYGERWSEEAVDRMQHDLEIAAISPTSMEALSHKTVSGIDVSHFHLRPVLSQSHAEIKSNGELSGPSLSCGFYRRKILTAVGGWNESVHWDNIDIELAMLLNALGLKCESLSSQSAKIATLVPKAWNLADIQQIAALAVAYGLRSSKFVTAMVDLVRGSLSGKPLRSIAWAKGILSRGHATEVSRRLKAAREELKRQENAARSLAWPTAAQYRRAA